MRFVRESLRMRRGLSGSLMSPDSKDERVDSQLEVGMK
jgi:hypothetical protein